MIDTLHIGLGTIGREILKAAVDSGRVRPVAGVDPLFAGQALGDLPEVPPLSALVSGKLGEALSSRPQVAILSTASTLEAIAPDLRALIKSGVNVVSTCEKLSYPWLEAPELAAEIDALAREHGVTVVGSGVNPGFVLDALPVLLARPCETVTHVRARRFVDTARRRRQLQAKTGASMSEQEFRSLAREGKIGHVGLAESAALIATGLGWVAARQDIAETIEPLIAEKRVRSDYFTVEPGQVKGQLQTATIYGEQDRTIELALRMELGLEEQYDEVIVEGNPSLHVRVEGGVFGDSATAGCTVNVLAQTLAARPGLLTVLDLPLK